MRKTLKPRRKKQNGLTELKAVFKDCNEIMENMRIPYPAEKEIPQILNPDIKSDVKGVPPVQENNFEKNGGHDNENEAGEVCELLAPPAGQFCTLFHWL